MQKRRTTKAFIALACSLFLVLAVSPAWSQEKVLEGAKKGAETVIDKTEDVGEAVGKGVKKGAETAIDKTEDVGEGVVEGVKDAFTDDDPAENEEAVSEGVQAPEQPEAIEREKSSPETTSSAAESETESRELPATAGEQPLLLLFGVLAFAGAAALKLFRRVPNS